MIPCPAPRTLLRLLLVALATGGAGCASLQVHSVHDPARDFSEYQRFDFRPLTTPAPGESNTDPLNNQLTGKRVQRAIDRELSGRGYAKVEADPDFRVSLQLASREKLDIRSYPSSFGYGGHILGASYVETYTEATLIIEFADAKSGDLVWQGWVVEPTASAAPSDEQLAEVVSAILATFPPGRESDP